MTKDNKQKRSASRFDVGSHGGCEALLFEFRDDVVRLMDEEPDGTSELPGEALEYLRWREPDFAIDSVGVTPPLSKLWSH